jgi:hypothetical protein
MLFIKTAIKHVVLKIQGQNLTLSLFSFGGLLSINRSKTYNTVALDIFPYKRKTSLVSSIFLPKSENNASTVCTIFFHQDEISDDIRNF